MARALEELPGVVAVRVDEAGKTARVTYEPGTISPDAMMQAIARVDVRLRIRHWFHRVLSPRTWRSGPWRP